MKTTFQELIQEHSPEIQELALQAQALVVELHPEARQEIETSWGGYLLLKQPIKGGNTVCYVSAHKKHVSLGFAQGAELPDPDGILEGKGKLQRHLKLKRLEDLQRPAVADLIRAAWSQQPDSAVLEEAVGEDPTHLSQLPRGHRNHISWPSNLQSGQKDFRRVRYLLTFDRLQS